jgi:hypothetical protein
VVVRTQDDLLGMVRGPTGAIRLRQTLNEEQLLNLSRFYESEMVQYELADGSIWLARGTRDSIPALPGLTDIRQLRRMVHTHPGEARLDLSLAPRGDLDGILLPYTAQTGRARGLGFGLRLDDPAITFQYEIVTQRTVQAAGGESIRPIWIRLDQNKFRELARAADRGQLRDQWWREAFDAENARLAASGVTPLPLPQGFIPN